MKKNITQDVTALDIQNEKPADNLVKNSQINRRKFVEMTPDFRILTPKIQDFV